jgi:hypothetical protein
MRIWIRTLLFSLQICGFTICGLGRQEYLRICDLRMNHYNFEDLLFADGTPQKFADLRFADESLRICGCEICGLATLRNLRICYCGMRPTICGLAICGITNIIACQPQDFFIQIFIGNIKSQSARGFTMCLP